MVVQVRLDYIVVDSMLAHLAHEFGTFTGLFFGEIKSEALRNVKLLTKYFEFVPYFGFTIHGVNVRKAIFICKYLGILVAIK